MRYIVVFTDESGTQYRYFNPLTDEDVLDLDLPKCFELIREDQPRCTRLRAMTWVNDGLTPLFFDPSNPEASKPNKEAGNSIIASMLLVVGHCERSLKKTGEYDLKSSALSERLEFLYTKSREHSVIMKRLEKEEMNREDVFLLSSKLLRSLELLKESSKDLAKISKDIHTILGHGVALNV